MANPVEAENSAVQRILLQQRQATLVARKASNRFQPTRRKSSGVSSGVNNIIAL